jgi:hypothetical protein
MKLTGETEVFWEKPVPVPLCPPEIPHGRTRDRTRASAVGGRRLTSCAMARPSWAAAKCEINKTGKICFLCFTYCVKCVKDTPSFKTSVRVWYSSDCFRIMWDRSNTTRERAQWRRETNRACRKVTMKGSKPYQHSWTRISEQYIAYCINICQFCGDTRLIFFTVYGQFFYLLFESSPFIFTTSQFSYDSYLTGQAIYVQT